MFSRFLELTIPSHRNTVKGSALWILGGCLNADSRQTAGLSVPRSSPGDPDGLQAHRVSPAQCAIVPHLPLVLPALLVHCLFGFQALLSGGPLLLQFPFLGPDCQRGSLSLHTV